jgi:hypothetical protein
MNDLQFAWRYNCLPRRCSVRLIRLPNEHPVCTIFIPRDPVNIINNVTGVLVVFPYNADICVHNSCGSRIFAYMSDLEQVFGSVAATFTTSTATRTITTSITTYTLLPDPFLLL